MRRRNLKGVMAIERQVYPRPWSPNLFLAEMNEQRDRLYLVARQDRGVIGYGGVMVAGDEAHVTTIAVDPALHR
jgi:ribosomal-protein-alanine N-acetyltransferase